MGLRARVVLEDKRRNDKTSGLLLWRREDWREIPLWGSAQAARDNRIRKVDSAAKRTRWEAGFRKLGDLTIEGGDAIVDWVHRKFNGGEHRLAEKAFSKMIEQVTCIDEVQLKEEDKVEIYYEAREILGKVWEWTIKGEEKLQEHPAPEDGARCKLYTDSERTADFCKTERRPESGIVYKPVELIKWRAGRNKAMQARANRFTEGPQELAKTKWVKGSPFFLASNGQIRRTLTRNEEVVVERIGKWRGVAEVCADNQRRWSRIWRGGRARKTSNG
ncbi:hypothetical protein R1sor_009797 [Riccia sorocarpa]|uniref:Uncharacterized protein n=1 Tax=Riccia sorocarpa TaxID=122646 RepID=A0ABD3HXW9_9MARC